MPNLNNLTKGLDDFQVAEIAMECEDCSVQGVVSTVQALIEGVLSRYDDKLDDAAKAALLAVAYIHVPSLADDLQEV